MNLKQKLNDADVIIVGAGPIGLTLACELALNKVKVLILEEKNEISKMVKAGSIGPIAGQLLKRRGMKEEIDNAEQETIERYKEMGRLNGIPEEEVIPSEHFAGIEKVNQRDPNLRRIKIEQPVLVKILMDRAHHLGVTILFNHRVESISQDEEIVSLSVCIDSLKKSFTASYVVGCDGWFSVIRDKANFEMVGTPAPLTGRQGIVELEDPSLFQHGFNYTEKGLVVWGLGVNRAATIEFDGPPDDNAGPLTREELQESIRYVSGKHITITSMSIGGRFKDDAMIARSYRNNRVFLAGDAAHIHAPFGGQGLNVGIGDAINLGWKLSAHIKGYATDGLLDTYNTERKIIGEMLMESVRAQAALMRPDPQSAALRKLFDRIMDIEDVGYLIADILAGNVYSSNDIRQGTDIIGRFYQDVELHFENIGKAYLSDLEVDGKSILLNFTAKDRLDDICESWSHLLKTVKILDDEPEFAAVLLRPDGYVAWLAQHNENQEDIAAGLQKALSNYFKN